MHNFTFHNPTKIIFGRGRETQIGTELQTAAIRRVLFLYGRQSIFTSGLHGRIMKSLEAAGIEAVELGGVVSNPVLSHARQGIELARREKVDVVLAVGGGSVLDEAKAIAVGVLSGADLWEYYLGRQVERALPVFAVLTLAASGSEMNGNSVLTNEETRQKYSLTSLHTHPRVSILNPELTFSVPPAYSAYSAVDAIAHVIEGYFTKAPGSRLQDRLVENIVHTVISTQERILEAPADYEARAEFMWAASLALNGLPVAGIGSFNYPNHMIEHALSALYDIPHGAGLAIVIPAWMQWYRPRRPEQFERFARHIFNAANGEAAVTGLRDWFQKIGAPVTLAGAGIPATDISKIAENAAALGKLWGMGEEYPAAVIAEILHLAR